MASARVLSLALAALLLGGCTGALGPAGGDQAASQRAPVKLGRVVKGDITGFLEFSGDLRTGQRLPITAHVPGTLARLNVQPGSKVNEGDAIAQLDQGLLGARVQRAQAALSAAQARQAQLQQNTRPEELAAAQAMVNATRARLNDLAQGGQASPAQALANLSAARQRLAELEGANVQAVAAAQADLDAASATLDAASRATDGRKDRVDQARQQLDHARALLAAARQPADPNALAQARDAVAVAERQMILSGQAASPGNVAEAQAFNEMAEQRLKLAQAPATEAELAAAQADVDQAAAALELARQSLRSATITAPTGGVISQTFVQAGALVGPGVAIAEVVPQDLSLEFPVPVSQLSGVASGQDITVTVSAYPQETFAGVVTATAPSVDPRDQVVMARAAVTDPQGKLKAGMFAQVGVQTGQHQGALLAPANAIVPHGADSAAWLVVDGRAKRAPVVVGAREGDKVEVLAGLSEGNEVIVSPPPGLADGDNVLGQ